MMLVCKISIIGLQRGKYFSTLTTNYQQNNDDLRNIFCGTRQVMDDKTIHNNCMTRFLYQSLDYEHFTSEKRIEKRHFNQ